MDWWGTSRSKANPVKLVKPVKPYTKKIVAKIPKQRLSWPQAQVRYPRMNPFGDSDHDGKLNMFDCRPFDSRKHVISRPTYESIKKHRRMLREAGYPPEIADRVGSWFTPKVMQYLKGARGLDESLTFEQSKELDKIRNNPTKVKVFFEQHRKETPIYQKYKKMKKAVNERYVAKHREQIRESKRKWNEKHKNYNKEYFQKNKERLMETTKKNKRIYSAVKKVLKESGGYDTKELKAKKYEPSAQQLVAAANEGSYEGSYEGSKSSASEDKI